MGYFPLRVIPAAFSVQHPPDGLCVPPAPGVIQLEGLPGDRAGHQFIGGHLQRKDQYVPPLFGQLIRQLHTKRGLSQRADGSQHIETVIEASVQRTVQLGKAGFQCGAGGLILDILPKRRQLSGG